MEHKQPLQGDEKIGIFFYIFFFIAVVASLSDIMKLIKFLGKLWPF